MAKHKARKTVDIATIVNNANAFFRDSDDNQGPARSAVQFFVDKLLMDAKQYRGFNYLMEKDVEAGKTFGISWPDEGKDPQQPLGEPKFHDQTRIFFYK